MTDEPVYGLTASQHSALGQLVRGAKTRTRPAPFIPPANRADAQIARLMTIGDSFPVYNPLETRPAAIFELSRNTQQAIVKFYGEDLRGDVWLTIGDLTVRVDCRADSEELREKLQALADCRITAFPGMWEFAFDDSVTELPEITCEPFITSNSSRFLGGAHVVQEGWRSVSADGVEPSEVEVIDSIPYIEGEVKLGSIAIATRFGASLYLAGQWSCPAYSFRSL